MSKTARIGAAVVVVGAAIIMFLAFREFRIGRRGIRASYTSLVKSRDVIDSARNSFHALSDAELRAENYVLTGETVYFEAYNRDIQDWQDESGTLEVIAAKDSAVGDLLKAGQRTAGELAALISIYQKDGRDPAIARIGKSSSIVYLDQTYQQMTEIVRWHENYAIGSGMLKRSDRSSFRLVVAAGGFFVLTIAALLILLLEARRRPEMK